MPQVQATTVYTPPTGAMFAWGTASAPTGYLLCDGSAVSRTTYAALFNVISTTFGVGDGSSTFNIPDFRAKVGAGYKASDGNFGTLGASVGAATVATNVTVATQPAFSVNSHTHNLSSNGYALGTNPTGRFAFSRQSVTSYTPSHEVTGTAGTYSGGSVSTAITLAGATDGATATTTRTADVALTNNATSVVQQSITVNWIIKY